MNRELEKFLRAYLDHEQAFDTSGSLRRTLHAFRPEYVAAVREGLKSALTDGELSTADYERITDIEFASEEALHAYLCEMFQYLFETGERQPLPPE
ncbi:hypothetical protein [Streptomyces endophyticus]|uniref:CdiI immunity protein domain-containing protein n=1 Tax=Streptomyces endophyticus TaxID=714166 RepID=A0ABU6F5T9_9ACTN|nr:hypothetical protein [Streptomyces endophyticus]MEB8339385.1 hypothetical protein [Streptomyces endophyticus]